jgi:hypothetical protein
MQAAKTTPHIDEGKESDFVPITVKLLYQQTKRPSQRSQHYSRRRNKVTKSGVPGSNKQKQQAQKLQC